MKLEEFMVELSIGVLSNLADGNEGSGVIENEDLNKLYLYTKQGLTRLYTHFPLVTKEETIAIHPNVREYPMTTPDLIKVLKASSNTLGIELPLQVGNVCEVNNINYFRLGTVPTESDAITLLVQVDHAPISKNNPTQTLVLPSILIEALQNYVAFRVYSNMNTAVICSSNKVL